MGKTLRIQNHEYEKILKHNPDRVSEILGDGASEVHPK